MRFKKINVPPCTGYKDYWGEFDCDADPDVIDDCSDCLSAYCKLGGNVDPYTGKHYAIKHVQKVLGVPKEIQKWQTAIAHVRRQNVISIITKVYRKMGQIEYNPEADEISNDDLDAASDFYDRLKDDPKQLSLTWTNIQ